MRKLLKKCDRTKKNQIVTKLMSLNCNKNQKLKLLQNLLSKIVKQIKDSNCYKNQKLKL